MKKITLITCFSILAFIGSVQAQVKPYGKHKEDTQGFGSVYIFVPYNYSMCPSEMFFMAEFANIPGITGGVSYVVDPSKVKPLYKSKEEFENSPEIQRILSTVTEKSSKQMANMFEKARSFTKSFPIVTENLVKKYNVTTFPSFIYLAPDKNIYRFAFESCNSEKAVKQFKSILKDFQTGKRRKVDSWKFGEEKQAPSRF